MRLQLPRAHQATVAVLAASVMIVLTGAFVSSRLEEPGPSVCNREAAGSPSLMFGVDSVAALRERIPSWLKTPELDAAEGPLTVVIFEGPHQAIAYYPPFQPDAPEPATSFENVVCVVRGGIDNYYPWVDLSGLNLDGLSIDRLSP